MSEPREKPANRGGRGTGFEHALMSRLARAGVVPHTYLLTTIGRTSGLPRSTPVTLVEADGRRWLVAPYGAVSWVHNARAAGEVRLTRGRRTEAPRIREAHAEEAGLVLKQYAGIAAAARSSFAAAPGDPVDAFVAEAHAHPVFELIAAD